jgi:translocation and assembly module TamA
MAPSLSRRFLVAMALLCSAPALANIEIDIHGIDEEEIRANVLVYLSFDRYRTSDSLSDDTVERLHDRVEREVRAALKPFGYYAPTVRSKLDKHGAKDWRVSIDIEPGAPIVMESINIAVHGPGADDPLFARIAANPPLHRGDRLSHAAYEKIKGDLQRTAATYGYLEARMLRNELLVDTEKHTASAVLEIETGERYRFGATHIEQDAIDERLVRRYIRYSENEPYDLTQLLRTQFALDDSQYFASVEVLPGEADRATRIVPISIRAEVNRRFRYSFGLGYGTDTQERGTATWEDRRVNRRGHHFSMELEAATVAQSLKSRYVVPIGDPALEKLSFELTAEQRKLADLDTRSFDFEPSITQVRGRWQWVWFVTATRTTTESALENRTDTLLIPGVNLASIPQGYLGEALFSRGFFAELRGSHSLFGSDSDFLQLRVQAERAFDLNPRWHLLLRGDLGASLVAHFSELPGSVRFFAGGDRSVRGFGYNDLSPTQDVTVKDADGNDVVQTIKVGGKHLFTSTVEIVRDLPRHLGIAVFADAGNAFDKFGDPLEYSAGVGIRWRLPVVTLGIDVAQPLSEPGVGPRLHINFSPKL